MIKTIYLFPLLLLAMLTGCSKESDNAAATSKTVVYEVSMEQIEGDAELTFTGEYVDRKGQKVVVDNVELPFRIELKNVPLDVKTGFNGRLFSVNATKLIGSITMKVTGIPGNRVMYDNTKSLNHTNGIGFNREELREKTTFSFSE